MRTHPIMKGAPPLIRTALLALGVALASATPAWAVLVTCGNGSGLAGQTIEITLSTDNVTGLGIQSLQFDLTYNQNIVTPVGVSEAGTSTGTAGWNNATFSVTPGRVRVSDAGAVAITGSGALIKIQFLINPAQLSATSTSLVLSSTSFIFNEGTPTVTTANGTLTVNQTPIITVSPNTGEVIRTQTLQFSVSGTVTNPVSWFTTDNAIATISGTGLLTGVTPGTVRVFAVDAAARRDTTDGDILIRGMGLTSGTASVLQGQTVDVPLTVTSLSGLGIRSGQVTLSFNGNLLTATSLLTPGGTLLNGYGTSVFNVFGSTCTVDFGGTTDLTGSGVLCYVRFLASTSASGGTAITVAQALFNETLTAKPTSGTVTVTPLPSITVAPDQVTLLAGQTQLFTVSGSPTLPITWSTLDPLVASINSSGLLTAIAGGVTKVHAVDAVGSTDDNISVTVYDFNLSLPTVSVPPGSTFFMPLTTDRSLSGLNVRAFQYTLSFNPAWVVSITAQPIGLVSVWGSGGLVQNPNPAGTLRVATAGSAALGSGGTEVQRLQIVLPPSVPLGTNIPLTLTAVVFNEGKPSPQIVNGLIQVRSVTDVAHDGEVAFSLGACEPNPVRTSARIPFTIPSSAHVGDRVRLAVYGIDGRLVRTLVDEPATPGVRTAKWDARDAAGASVSAGVYFYRLTAGARALSRKLAVVP